MKTRSAVWRPWLAAASVVVAIAMATVLFVQFAPRTYTATSIVALVPDEDTEPSGDLVRLAVSTYSQLANSESLTASLASSYGEDASKLAENVTADVMPSTNTVVVSVSWNNPDRAAELTNGVTALLVDFSDKDPLLAAYVVAPAVSPTTPSFPPKRAALVGGAIIAVVVGAGTFMVASGAWPFRRRSE